MSTYGEAMSIVQRLRPEDQLRLLEELDAIVHRPNEPQHSILELRGLGKEIWGGIDAQEYVNQERASWD